MAFTLRPEILNLRGIFKQYFEVVPALTEALKNEAFSIRHKVYCEELRWEAERPDGHECDEYDAQSLHMLIRHIKTGEFIGCTRIVRVRNGDQQNLMPFERSCEKAIDRSILDPANLPRDTVAEISRLAVISRYRRRKGESKSAIPLSDIESDGKEPRFPFIPVGLYLGTVELARLHGIKTLFVLTEPRLSTHFRKLGVRIQAIGTPIEHRGQRLPSMMDTNTILGNLRMFFRPLYRAIAQDIVAGLGTQGKQTGSEMAGKLAK